MNNSTLIQMWPKALIFGVLVAAVLPWWAPSLQAASEGSDIEIGGTGSEPGHFSEIRDLTVDRAGLVYVLEGVRYDPQGKPLAGNARVQVLTADGKPRFQFPLPPAASGMLRDPQRIAVDAAGMIYVTDPGRGLVLRFSPQGVVQPEISIPHALGISTWTVAGKEVIAVLPWRSVVVDGKWVKVGGDRIEVIMPGGKLGKPVPLAKTLDEVSDLTSDRHGNLYALAAVNQIYKFDAAGAVLAVIGSADRARAEDGSELLHSVAVDAACNIYSMTYGNPGKLVRFNQDMTSIAVRDGVYKWADPWSVHSSYTPLAIGPDDRMWVAQTHEWAKNDPNIAHFAPSPSILRTNADFFDSTQGGTVHGTALSLGFKPELGIQLPQMVAYDLKPVEVEVMVTKARRRVTETQVAWRAVDVFRTEIASGNFSLPLSDGVDARHVFTVTPPRQGWFMVTCDFSADGQKLRSLSRFFGVTSHHPGLLDLASTTPVGGPIDPMRSAFSGLMNVRLHAGTTPESLDTLDSQLVQCEKAGVTSFVQFTDRKNCEDAVVRAAVSRFKGRVKVWEVMNEPNFSFSGPVEYVALLKRVHALIKELDPAAKVMGPNVCGVDLNWHEGFYAAGGKDFIDILSIHDYEGHEGIDPVHWRYKIPALRAVMAKYGDADKPIWQTERAISGVRGDNLLPGAQAVRLTLHYDIMESLGIPPEHNNHFYANDHGFAQCPSWVWSSAGPHPAVLAMRTRQALTVGRRYTDMLDFGPTGNRLYLGLRYAGDDGTTVIVRNFGALDAPLVFTATGASVEVVDAYGNRSTVPVRDGTGTVGITQMPTYLLLAKGQRLTAPQMDFGRNIAERATLTFSGPSTRDLGLLTDGVLATTHVGDPRMGDTDGRGIWSGTMTTTPPTLDLVFAQAQTIDKVLLFGQRADNGFCALLDYDLQYRKDGAWTTLEQVRVPCPPSEPGNSPGVVTNTWYFDNNLGIHRFAPVTTDALRVVVRRVTNGFVPDLGGKAWGTIIPAMVMLREVEVYAAQGPVTATATLATARHEQPFANETMTVTLANRTTTASAGTLTVVPPSGWKAVPATVPFTVAANATSVVTISLTPPVPLAAGRIPIDLHLTATDGRLLSQAYTMLTMVPPVELQPQALERLAPQLPVSLVVRNPGVKPVSGTVKLTTTLAGKPFSSELPIGPIAPKESAAVAFTIPVAKVPGDHLPVTYTATVNGLVTVVDQDLHLNGWNVVGPFAPEAAQDFGPEKAIDLTAAYRGADGKELRWMKVPFGAHGFIDLYRALSPNSNVCAYAVGYFRAPTARKAILAIGSDDGAKIWLNSQLIYTDATSHGAEKGKVKLPIELKKGWNTVLFKVMQGGGGWGFYCDLQTTGGEAMNDVEYSSQAPGR